MVWCTIGCFIVSGEYSSFLPYELSAALRGKSLLHKILLFYYSYFFIDTSRVDLYYSSNLFIYDFFYILIHNNYPLKCFENISHCFNNSVRAAVLLFICIFYLTVFIVLSRIYWFYCINSFRRMIVLSLIEMTLILWRVEPFFF